MLRNLSTASSGTSFEPIASKIGKTVASRIWNQFSASSKLFRTQVTVRKYLFLIFSRLLFSPSRIRRLLYSASFGYLLFSVSCRKFASYAAAFRGSETIVILKSTVIEFKNLHHSRHTVFCFFSS